LMYIATVCGKHLIGLNLGVCCDAELDSRCHVFVFFLFFMIFL